MAELSAVYPNPTLEGISTWVIHPYLLEPITIVSGGPVVDMRSFGDRIMSFSPPRGWREWSPDELVARNLDRWFVQEVRALFRSNPGDSGADDYEVRIEPKFRWFSL